MEKTWLIRTKNNHILGPISLQKVQELLDKGSIKGDDELCAGNGYWFYVREKELVTKYIINEVKQGFNPVTEAETLLARESIETEEGTMVPNDDDLAYPDEIAKEESTIDQLREKASSSPKKKIIKRQVATPKMKAKLKTKSQSNIKAVQAKSFFNQNTLSIFAVVFLIIAVVAFFFRRHLVKEFIEVSNHIISPVYAQVIPDIVKKKLLI